MQYSREVLNRQTGELVTIDLGNWISVRELGEMHGHGRRQTTEVLRHLQVMQIEGVGRTARHGLASWFVERGLGKRLKRKTDKYPFYVISPEGQAWIDERWSSAVAAIEQERMTVPVEAARSALSTFQDRRREMTIQMQACWLADHFPELSQEQMAAVLSVSQPVVNRYLAIRADQRSKAAELKAAYR